MTIVVSFKIFVVPNVDDSLADENKDDVVPFEPIEVVIEDEDEVSKEPDDELTVEPDEIAELDAEPEAIDDDTKDSDKLVDRAPELEAEEAEPIVELSVAVNGQVVYLVSIPYEVVVAMETRAGDVEV